MAVSCVPGIAGFRFGAPGKTVMPAETGGRQRISVRRAGQMTVNRNAWIQERAYNLWLEAGRPHGTDQEHWYRAERELLEQETGLQEDSPATASSPARAASRS